MEEKQNNFCRRSYYLLPVSLDKKVSLRLTERFVPARVLTVKVLSAGESGGSEMWLTASQGSPLLEELGEIPSKANYNGICEYRKAEEYGYAFDFLISFGDNLGSVFDIPYTPSVNAQLLLYCQGVGGVIELTEGDTSPVIIDTYSSTGEIRPFELKKSVWDPFAMNYSKILATGLCCDSLQWDSNEHSYPQ